jgi:glutamate carboxypeptidase
MEQKLAAIFSADIQSYSRLMGDDKIATVRTLTAYRKVITTLIHAHRGRVVDSPGDNLLAEFASVVDAVQCATEIQQELSGRNAELLPHRQMTFWIGINVDDVLTADGRLYGNGVNIAVRLEGLAEAGAICISEVAYIQGKNKLALGYVYIGEKQVKNIAEPVRAYKIRTEPDTTATPVTSQGPPTERLVAEKPPSRHWLRTGVTAVVLWCVLLALLVSGAHGAPVEPVLALAKQEKPALLKSLRELVSIESGSRDLEGLAKLARLLAGRLQALGGRVELIAPGADVCTMHDTPKKVGDMVRATFVGTGTKHILLIAHMDTVYSRGMLVRQSFRVEGNRAYGLGIADDKQGIAVILHTLAILQALPFKEYGTLTVLINGDEELSSPASRSLLTKLGGEHDVVFSLEASRVESDKVSLATSGIAAVSLTVRGRASHAGSSPEQGINALYELAHQILQTRDLSEPAVGLKLNWTLATAGTNRNVIPASATATADVRVQRVADYDRIEHRMRERVQKRLFPEAEVDLSFERRRPPLEATAVSRSLAAHAQQIYRELGKKLVVDEMPEGSGTDAAFAALRTQAPVIERFGLQGHGAHSADVEYVLIDSIEPRLYLLTRLIMEVSGGRVPEKLLINSLRQPIQQ